MRRNPAVIHFATHFVASDESSRYLAFGGQRARSRAGTIDLIALSLNQAGETELLTAPEIAQWTVRADLVTLSGCHSAAGAALPGAGLLGLTRAWLAAGARSVVGSLWDIPDDSGALFAALYRNLSAQRSADSALALDSAQREMIHNGGWMAQPRYWGAYFVVANE
jgi:CHAT domain-containing protein